MFFDAFFAVNLLPHPPNEAMMLVVDHYYYYCYFPSGRCYRIDCEIVNSILDLVNWTKALVVDFAVPLPMLARVP